MEGVAIEQFAFEGGKEALAERIVITVTYRAHRGADPGISTALAERQGCVLTTLV